MACQDCKPAPVYTHTLTVQKPGTTVDAAGLIDLTNDDNWTTQGRIRARFITKGGSEGYVLKQTQAETALVIECPATTLSRSIDPSWRLALGERRFDILASYLINETGKVVRIEVKEQR